MILTGMYKQIITYTEAMMTPQLGPPFTETFTRSFSCDLPVWDLVWHCSPDISIQSFTKSIHLTYKLFQLSRTESVFSSLFPPLHSMVVGPTASLCSSPKVLSSKFYPFCLEQVMTFPLLDDKRIAKSSAWNWF